jgi:predicted metallo-beta-lactamase superfamily hydrolase
MRLTDPIIREGPQLKLSHISFDSLGTMGMCVQVQTPEVTLTIDPGAAIEAGSFPLPVERRHALYEERLAAARTACTQSQAIVISHFHLDHLILERSAELYGGKTIFTRDPESLTDKQMTTANRFLKTIDGLPKEVIFCDGRKFKYGKTAVSFSPALWHGVENAEPGTVVMTEVSRGREKVLVTSDVGGPLTTEATDYICNSKARTVVLDGYPTYLLGQFATDFNLVRSLVNICRILSCRDLETLAVDHHMARDYRYPAFFKLAYDKALKLKKHFGTVAELAGGRSLVLEGYQNYGPTKWQKWFPLEPPDARKVIERAVAEKNLTQDWLDAFVRWVG